MLGGEGTRALGDLVERTTTEHNLPGFRSIPRESRAPPEERLARAAPHDPVGVVRIPEVARLRPLVPWEDLCARPGRDGKSQGRRRRTILQFRTTPVSALETVCEPGV